MNHRGIEITRIWIRTDGEDPKPNTLGYADVEINRSFRIVGLRILQGRERIFVAMPDREKQRRCSVCAQHDEDGMNRHSAHYCQWCGEPLRPSDLPKKERFIESFHPTNNDARNFLEKAILEEYARLHKLGRDARTEFLEREAAW